METNGTGCEVATSTTGMDPWTSSTVNKMDVDHEATPLISNQDTTTKTAPLNDFGTTPFADLSTSNVASQEEGGKKKVVVMEWHSCGICLEEMIDSDLLTHLSCGAILCDDCLQASKQHTMKEDGKMPCPVSHYTMLYT